MYIFPFVGYYSSHNKLLPECNLEHTYDILQARLVIVYDEEEVQVTLALMVSFLRGKSGELPWSLP